MSRRPRIQWSELDYHLIVRCNNQAFRLECDDDFLSYLAVLNLVKNKHGLQIFNYELMNSHVHLFLRPGPSIPLSKSMQLINWKFAKEYNRKKSRVGHFWLERYTNIPVQSEKYALALMRYINRNPVRAGMVRKPGDWRWSGYPALALCKPDELITFHETYLSLGHSSKERQINYSCFVNELSSLTDIRETKFSETSCIGSEEFKKKILGKELAL